MNKNTLWGLVILALVAGGIIWYAKKGEVQVPSSAGGPAAVSGSQASPTPPATGGGTNYAGQPVVVTDAHATVDEHSAVVTGKVTPDGALTTYWYEYGLGNNLGSRTKTQSLGSGYIAIPAPAYIIGLASDTTYYFRLVAQNQYGQAPGVIYSFRTQANPPIVGGLPDATTVSAGGISRTAATLKGIVNPNNAATQYWFEYGTTASLGNTSAFGNLPKDGDGIDYSAARNVSLPVSDLEPATTYYFRLDAQNQFGTVNGAILSFQTAGPATPVAPMVKTKPAADVGTSTAMLHGSVNPGGAETSYWFEYSTGSFLGSVLTTFTSHNSAGAGTTEVEVSANLSDLSPATTYYFRLVARNNQGTVIGDRFSFKTDSL